jgi:hypothetical protein
MFSEGGYKRENFVSLSKKGETKFGCHIALCHKLPLQQNLSYIKFPFSFKIGNLLLKSGALLMYSSIRSKSMVKKCAGMYFEVLSGLSSIRVIYVVSWSRIVTMQLFP